MHWHIFPSEVVELDGPCTKECYAGYISRLDDETTQRFWEMARLKMPKADKDRLDGFIKELKRE